MASECDLCSFMLNEMGLCVSHVNTHMMRWVMCLTCVLMHHGVRHAGCLLWEGECWREEVCVLWSACFCFRHHCGSHLIDCHPPRHTHNTDQVRHCWHPASFAFAHNTEVGLSLLRAMNYCVLYSFVTNDVCIRMGK